MSTEDWTTSPAREDRALGRRLSHAAGHPVRSVYDLVNGPAPDLLIPMLVAELSVAKHPAVREGLLRALSVPTARGIAGQAAVEQYRATDDAHLRWVAANTLSMVATSAEADAIAEFIDEDPDDAVMPMLERALKRARRPKE